MTLTTLFSDKSQREFTKTLSRRSRAAMLYFGIVLFITFPLQYILWVFNPWFAENHLHGMTIPTYSYTVEPFSHHTDFSMFFVFVIILVMTLYMGLSQFSYLHTKRSVDVYHALPISRTTLLLGGVWSAFRAIVIPLAANYLVLITAGLIRMATLNGYVFSVPFVLLEFALWTVAIFATLCIVAFVAVQVGTIFDNFIFSCELLVIIPVIIWFTMAVCESLLRGFAINEDLFSFGAYASPITLIAERYLSSGADITNEYFWVSALMVLVWLVVGVGLLFVANYIYHRRRSEIAETGTTNSPLSLLGVLAVVYVTGIGGGMIMGDVFSVFGVVAVQQMNSVAFVVWTIIFSALTFILTQVILQRGFKGLRDSLARGGVIVAVVTVASVIFVTGGLGFEGRIPAADDVQSVTIGYRGQYDTIRLLDADEYHEYEDEFGKIARNYMSVYDLTLSESESIELVRQIHTISSEHTQEPVYNNYNGEFVVTYHLSNGMEMHRRYSNSEIQGAVESLLALEASREFTEKTHPAFVTEAEDYSAMYISDAYGLNRDTIDSQQDIERLLQAFRLDLLADDERMLAEGAQKAVCFIEFESTMVEDYTLIEQDTYQNGYITIYPHYENTIAALGQIGLEAYTEEPPLPEQIVVMPDGYGTWYNSDSVIHLSGIHNNHYNYNDIVMLQNDMDMEGIVVTDPDDIATILKAGYTRSIEVGTQGQPLMAWVFDEESESIGAGMFINYNDIPKHLRTQLPEWIREDFGDMEVTHPIPATTEVATMANTTQPDLPPIALSINADEVYNVEWSFGQESGGMTSADGGMLPPGEVVMFGTGVSGDQIYTVTVRDSNGEILGASQFTHTLGQEQISLVVDEQYNISEVEYL